MAYIICLDGLRKTTKTLSQDNWSKVPALKLEASEHKGVLPIRLRHLVDIYLSTHSPKSLRTHRHKAPEMQIQTTT
jgi:hypothetical protein